jgi:hypothetical protein
MGRFHVDAYTMLVDCLSKLEFAPHSLVSRLVNLTPEPPDDMDAPRTMTLNARDMEAILALARFFRRSEGQHEQLVVPRLLGWLSVLPQLLCTEDNEQFSFALVTACLEVCMIL